MNHDILREKLFKAMGSRVPIPARDKWADFIRSRGTRIVIRYEWIRDPRFYEWISNNRETLDIEDGTEWFGVFIWSEYVKDRERSSATL
jgi:hypothetical protein